MTAPGTPVRLATLADGAWARLHTADLCSEDCALLAALGLTARSRMRVCKSGDPCIVQVRTTRIGLSEDVARRILVIPV